MNMRTNGLVDPQRTEWNQLKCCSVANVKQISYWNSHFGFFFVITD